MPTHNIDSRLPINRGDVFQPYHTVRRYEESTAPLTQDIGGDSGWSFPGNSGKYIVKFFIVCLIITFVILGLDHYGIITIWAK